MDCSTLEDTMLKLSQMETCALIKYSTWLVLFLLLSCEKSELRQDCPDQGDRAIDVLAGPNSIVFGGEIWAFLSNEYGGRGEVIHITGFPFFLNWEGGCQDEYAVNLIEFQYNQTFLTTFWKFPVGEAVQLRPILPQPNLRLSYIAPPPITINNLPNFSDVELVPPLGFGSAYDASSRSLSIEIPIEDRWRGGRYAYLRLWDEDTKQHRAILIDLQEGGAYDYLVQSIGMSWQSISTADDVHFISVREVVDPSSGEWVLMGEQVLSDGTAELLLLEDSRPYLVSINSDAQLPSFRRTQDYYPELPAFVDFPPSPIIDHDYEVDQFSLTTTDPINLSVIAEQPTGVNHQRIIRGIIPAGQHTLRSPDLPPAFRERHPDVDLPLNLSDYGYRILLWHFPAAATAADYWRADEWNGLDTELFHYERIVVR